MRLSDVTMETLLPNWMRDNADDVALAAEVDKVIKEIYLRAQLLTIWDKLDQLPEEVLDRIAWELDIDWYNASASYETKVELIRDSDYVHAHKGTVAAVERVIAAYFGDQRVLEWYEYGGEPHHFKVFTTEPTLVANNYERFLAMLNKVKRKSSKLDSILIGLTGMEQLYLGDGWRNFAHEIHAMPRAATLYCDSVSAQRDTVTVSMGLELAIAADEIVYMLYGARAMERSSDFVTITVDYPLVGDLVGYQYIGNAVAEHDRVFVRIGG